MKLILGSSSPNRKEMLDRMGIAYEVAFPDYEEVIIPERDVVEQVEEFALGKAKSIYDEIFRQAQNDNSKEKVTDEDFIILGFDSMIACDGKAVGKADTKKKAFEDIQSFVGKKQQVITGMAGVGMWKGKPFELVIHEATDVEFRSDISNCQIRSYLDFGDWEGKCGSYSILGPGIFLLEKIDGDFQNIIGIPVVQMGKMIHKITGKNPVSVLEKE